MTTSEYRSGFMMTIDFQGMFMGVAGFFYSPEKRVAKQGFTAGGLCRPSGDISLGVEFTGWEKQANPLRGLAIPL